VQLDSSNLVVTCLRKEIHNYKYVYYSLHQTKWGTGE